MGRTFRMRSHPESASHSNPKNWDALSAEDLNRKLHPSFWSAGGTRFSYVSK